MEYHTATNVSDRLVKIKPGDYHIVSGKDKAFLNIKNPSPGLLVKYVGQHATSRVPCWHVLVNESVVLAWEDNFEVDRKCQR